MVALFAVTDRTDGQDNTDIGVVLAQHVDGALQVIGTLVNGKLFLGEEGLWALLTVVDYLAGFL